MILIRITMHRKGKITTIICSQVELSMVLGQAVSTIKISLPAMQMKLWIRAMPQTMKICAMLIVKKCNLSKEQ